MKLSRRQPSIINSCFYDSMFQRVVKLKKRNKHDRGIIEVVKRLESSSNDYSDVSHNLEYKIGNAVVGELDVIAYKNGKIVIVEFKSNNSYNLRLKAIKQLTRAKDYFSNYKVHTFYAYWDKHKIHYEKINIRRY